MRARSDVGLKADMDKKQFVSFLERGLKSIDLKVAENGLENLFLYFSELKKWSEKINLIAKNTSDEEIVEKHFLDSLTLLGVLPDQGCHLLDIGTGAGFPGLVVKAARPSLRVTMVEPRQKRVSFLNHIIRSLQLKEAQVICDRIEQSRLPDQQTISHVTSRALNDIGEFCDMLLPLFGEQGRDVTVVCMKGPKWQEELDAAKTQGIAINDFSVKEMALPFSHSERFLLSFAVGNICRINN